MKQPVELGRIAGQAREVRRDVRKRGQTGEGPGSGGEERDGQSFRPVGHGQREHHGVDHLVPVVTDDQGVRARPDIQLDRVARLVDADRDLRLPSAGLDEVIQAAGGPRLLGGGVQA